MSIKVGVIGVGYLGRHHARIYSELPDVELSAVVDTDGVCAGEISDKYCSSAYSDYKAVIGGLDAVSIATPTPAHFPIAMDCLRAGLDVLVEKPMTMTLDEADVLIKEAKDRGRILQVGHLERYNPAVVAVSGMVASPAFIEAERVSPFLERALNVDVTLDLMIHDIDIVMSLLRDAGIERMSVVGAKVLSAKVDVAKAWIEFTGGAKALITASRLSKDKRRMLKVYQRDSYIELDYVKKEIKRYGKGGDGMTAERIEVPDKEPLKEELIDFIECVRTRRRPKVSGEEGRKALNVALEITKMITDNQEDTRK